MQKIIEDKELGPVVLRKHVRATKYTIRLRGGKVSVSLPVYGTYKYALEFLSVHRNDLINRIKTLPQQKTNHFDETELRKKAKETLPSMLKSLANFYGFSYSSVKITKSKGRWGSCSSRANINLSLYLMLLPEHLIEYVLLHELCHTKEMNHGPRFWALMDSVTKGKAKELRRELKVKSEELRVKN